MSDHSHLWNNLPIEQRQHLMPYQIESHIRFLQQARSVMVRHQKAQLAELDGIIQNCKDGLKNQLAFNQSKGGK